MINLYVCIGLEVAFDKLLTRFETQTSRGFQEYLKTVVYLFLDNKEYISLDLTKSKLEHLNESVVSNLGCWLKGK